MSFFRTVTGNRRLFQLAWLTLAFVKLFGEARCEPDLRRLNTPINPLNYTIRLRPVLEQGFGNHERFTSPSSVTIRVVAKETSDKIEIHQRNLAIDSDQVTVTNVETGVHIPIAFQSVHADKDLYSIQLEQPFQSEDRLDIYIPYTISLSKFNRSSESNNNGLFWDSYVDHETSERSFYVATRLEPFNARALFPVFDGDATLKATFKVIVGRLDNGKYHAISSADLNHSEPDSEDHGWVWDHFQETPPVSPHHLSVVVSDFAYYPVEIPEMRISAWGPRQFIEHGGGTYAVETAARLMRHYETKFKMEYPLSKLDILYLPSFEYHFDVTPLHTLGIINHPLESSTAPGFVHQNEDKYLSQEIVKQWFGIIASCVHSTTDLKLNEGLASYLSLYWTPENKDSPGAQESTSFPVIRFKQYMMNVYGYWSELTTLDSMDYASSMLKMMEGFLNEAAMETALIDTYLHRMKFKEATEDDLFSAMQESIKMHKVSHMLPVSSVKEIMTDWNIQNGYPLIRVESPDQHSIHMHPERFISFNELAANQTDDAARWWIPVKLTTEDGFSDRFWLPRQSKIPETTYFGRNGYVLDTHKWLLLNSQATGYYRVLYDTKLTDLLSTTLLQDHTALTPLARIQLLDDYFQLAKTNYVPIESALEMTRYLGKEKDPHVWMVVSTNMQAIMKRFKESDKTFHTLIQYFAPKVQQALNTTGGFRRDRNGAVAGVNYDFLYWCGNLEVPACVEFSNELMAKWKANPGINPFVRNSLLEIARFSSHLSKWLRASMYCSAVAADTNKSTWNFVLKMLEDERYAGDHNNLAQSLGCTKDPELLSRLLEDSLDPNSPIGKRSKAIYRYLGLQRPDMREKLFDFAKMNLVSGQMKPEDFADIIHDMKSFTLHVPGMPQAVNHFIHSNRKIIGQPLMSSLEQSVELIVECKGCEWWSSVGNRVRSWLEKEKI